MKNYLFILCIALGLCAAVYPSTCRAQPPEDLFFRSLTDGEKVVERVMSADMLVLADGEKIRLIGIKAPPAPKRKERMEVDEFNIPIRTVNPITSIEEQAFQFAQELLEGKTVRLEFDDQIKDDNWYTLAYVFLPDGTLANAEVLRQGFAQLRIMLPNIKYAAQLRAAYREARTEKRGLQGQ